MTMPLVLDNRGVKFGKTEGNALWLDKNKTSSYELYQYLINSDDSVVIDYLKKLTFLTKEEIEDIEKEHSDKPELRIAQKRLAEEVITFLHGKDEYLKAVNISECLFSGNIASLSAKDIKTGLKEVPTFKLEGTTTLLDMLVDNKICSSKREARELISGNSISVNGSKITDTDYEISKSIAIDSEIIVIRRGKKKYYIGVY